MKKKRKQPAQSKQATRLAQEEFERRYDAERSDNADRQLFADLRQLTLELTKLTALATTIAQQALEAAERYRKARG